MARSPFSSAGGGNADSSPYSSAHRARGGRVSSAKEAKGSSPGFIEGDGLPRKRLDRKCGGAAKKGMKRGGKAS